MLEACVTFHILFWVYVIFGSFLGRIHARFILLWLIPFVWLLHMAPFHALFEYEAKSVGASDLGKREKLEAVNTEVISIFPFMEPFFTLQLWCEDNCAFNPIGGQGMLILGAIVASRVLV
jgi:hypothetical protein